MGGDKWGAAVRGGSKRHCPLESSGGKDVRCAVCAVCSRWRYDWIGGWLVKFDIGQDLELGRRCLIIYVPGGSMVRRCPCYVYVLFLFC